MSLLEANRGDGNQQEDSHLLNTSHSDYSSPNSEHRSYQEGVDYSVNAQVHVRATRVKFINTTNKNVDLFWLNYEGQKVKVSTLGPLSGFQINARPFHPWIFRDADTSEPLVIKKLNVKGTYFEIVDYLRSIRKKQLASRGNNTTLSVFIQQPIDELRTLALRTVRQKLVQKEDCFSLDVPISIQFELAKMFA